MTGRYTPDDVGPVAPRHAVTFGPGAVVVGFLVGVITLALAYMVNLFIGFAGAALAVLPVATVFSVVGSIPTALTTGGAGALARASVWKLVRLRGT